jgi:hypothetical protein
MRETLPATIQRILHSFNHAHLFNGPFERAISACTAHEDTFDRACKALLEEDVSSSRMYLDLSCLEYASFTI